MKYRNLQIEKGLTWINAWRRFLFVTGYDQGEVRRFYYCGTTGWSSYQRR